MLFKKWVEQSLKTVKIFLLFWYSNSYYCLQDSDSTFRLVQHIIEQAVPSSGKDLLASQFMPVWLLTHKESDQQSLSIFHVHFK